MHGSIGRSASATMRPSSRRPKGSSSARGSRRMSTRSPRCAKPPDGCPWWRAASSTRFGLADAFGHGTGHGLGIEVHEDPRITRRRPDVDTQHEAVAPGMVFTIEPGAYLAGWGGVRIEDDVLVTAEGAEVLTDVTTELLEI